MAVIANDPDVACPLEFARFEKVRGEPGDLRVGDEYMVRLPGPWNGPVRVAERDDRSFRLATLRGHMEAGEIAFGAEPADGGMVFQIQSWARSGDPLFALLYDRIPVNRAGAAAHVGAVPGTGGADLGRPHPAPGGGPRPAQRRPPVLMDVERPFRRHDPRRALDAVRGRPFNFEPAGLEAAARRGGWNVDDYRQELPDGSFEAARRLMTDYEFADPDLVRGYYDPDAPLDGREMLLSIRFWGMRFQVGVRVMEVVDEERSIDGRPARVFGWGYGTLEGHLERGRMDYELREWRDTGEVEFRIHVVSRRGPIRNPVVRLGFRIFARREQIKFARVCCERMASLTAAALAAGPAAEATPGRRRGLAESPAPETDRPAERVASRSDPS